MIRSNAAACVEHGVLDSAREELRLAGIYEDDDGPLSEHAALQAAVGDCIHSWCELERALVDVLSWALNTPAEKASIVFNGISGFASKLNILDDLMRSELDARDESKFWTSMVSNLKELAAARNVLAHYSPIYSFCPERRTFRVLAVRTYRTD